MALKLWDSAWLDANLGAADAPALHGIRPPPSEFPDCFTPEIGGTPIENTEEAHAQSGSRLHKSADAAAGEDNL